MDQAPLPLIGGVHHDDDVVVIDRAFAVWIEATGRGNDYEVLARRPDQSLLTVLHGIPRADALRVAARIRDGIANDEPWAFTLIDVSAGKLRG